MCVHESNNNRNHWGRESWAVDLVLCGYLSLLLLRDKGWWWGCSSQLVKVYVCQLCAKGCKPGVSPRTISVHNQFTTPLAVRNTCARIQQTHRHMLLQIRFTDDVIIVLKIFRGSTVLLNLTCRYTSVGCCLAFQRAEECVQTWWVKVFVLESVSCKSLQTLALLRFCGLRIGLFITWRTRKSWLFCRLFRKFWHASSSWWDTVRQVNQSFWYGNSKGVPVSGSERASRVATVPVHSILPLNGNTRARGSDMNVPSHASG